MRKVLTLLLLLALGTTASSAYDSVQEDVIVVLRNTSGMSIRAMSESSGGVKEMSAVKSFAQSENVEVRQTFDELSKIGDYVLMAVHSDKEDGKSLLRKLSANPNVIGASLNRKYHACNTVNAPNDPDYYRLWGMEAINAPYAWQYSTGSSDVYVIVMDSGVDYEHEDLRDNFSHKYSANFMNDQKNFSDNRMEYYDRKGHGTHCAGTIAAVGNNGLGVPGVNWRAKIIAVRVLDAEGWCSALELVAGINYIAGLLAAKPDLNVAAVNISLGEENKKSPEEMIAGYDPLYLVLKLLSDMNRVVICVSAGNENSEVGAPNFDINGENSQGYYTYPPSYTGIDNMIAVAAANSDLTKASFSNYSRKYVDVAAPGVGIYSTVPPESHDSGGELTGDFNPYTNLNGTSMAAPHVTGAVTLLRSIFPQATASQLKAAIVGGADGRYLRDEGTSVYGFLDLKGAIDFLAATMSDDNAPKISDASPAVGVVNQPYKFAFVASGTEPISWDIYGTLPAGLSFNDGVITGTPESPDNQTVTIVAENDFGYDSFVLNISVDNVIAPVIASMDAINNAKTGFQYNAAVNIVKGTWPFSWYIVDSSDLKRDSSKLEINASKGVIDFLPENAGRYTITVGVSNDAGYDEKKITFNVKDAEAAMILGDYKLKTGVVGKVYGLALSQDYTFDSYVRSIEARGEVPVSWDVEGLPEGMYFEKDEENPLRILLKGIPRSAGEYPVRVLLSKNIGTANSPNIFTDSRDYTLSIIDNQPASFTAIGSFPQYFNKGTFSYNVIPLLGTPPLSVSYRGTLPDGLSFNKYTNSFMLSGVAEKTGTFSINITVSNDTGIASKDVTITILDPAVITTYYLPDGLKGEKYHAALSTLYDVPATWTVKGTLPGGLTFSASGDIDGTPAAAGIYSFDVEASFKDDRTASRKYMLYVNEKPGITTAAALPDGKQNTEYPLTFIDMTGTNPVSLSFVDGKIPEGLMLASNGYIHGTPTEAGTFTFTLEASNMAGTASKTFTLMTASDGSSPTPDPSPAPTPTPESDDPTPAPTPGPSATPETPKVGVSRGVSSLTLGEYSALDGEMIAAILPEITATESKTYTAQEISAFANVKLSSDVPAGSLLVWHPFARTMANTAFEASESTATFYDTDGTEVTEVPDNRTLNVSAYFEAGRTYAPVISAVRNEDGVGSSSGGCSACLSVMSLILCAIIFRKNSR